MPREYQPAPGQVSFDTINVDRPTYGVPNPITQIAGRGARDDDPKQHQDDPSQVIPGAPPNHGDFILPHVTTFQGVVSTISRVYRPSDEAIKDSLENARFMRNDLSVMECLEQRQRSTALLDWHLEPEDENDERAQWLVEQVTPIVQQIPRFVQYRENLLHAIWYGRYAISNQYRWKMIRGERRLVPEEWLPVNGDKIVFRYDDGSFVYDPNQVGIRVGAGYTTQENLATRWDQDRHRKVEATDYGLAYFLDPWERPFLTIHKHQIEDGEYESPTHAGRIHGLGVRSKIYWTWFQKQEALAFLMEFLERSAFGIEMWYYPWGNPQAEEKTRAAAEERIGQGRNIILVPRPMGEEGQSYGVERIEPGMAGADVLKDILTTYFGHLIKRYILGQTLTTEAESTGLGSNLASVHLDTYLQIIRYDAMNLQETLTRDLIEVIVKQNWPQYADHKIKFVIETEAPDVEAKLAAWKQAYEMNLKLKASDVYELIAAEPPEGDDEVLENPQAGEAMAQQQQMEQQQGMDQQRMQMEQEQATFDRSQAVDQAEYTKEKDRQDLERELLTAQPIDAMMQGPVERYGDFCQHCGGKHDPDKGERMTACPSDQPRSEVEEPYSKPIEVNPERTTAEQISHEVAQAVKKTRRKPSDAQIKAPLPYGFEESKHPRVSEGSSEGGQFGSGGGGAEAPSQEKPSKVTTAGVQPVVDSLLEQFPDLSKLHVAEDANGVELQGIEVDAAARGSMTGSRVIRALQEYATQQGKPITLVAAPEPRKKKALDSFYKSHGFKNPGRSRDFSLRPAGYTHIWYPESGLTTRYAKFVESEHPRDDSGKFTDQEGGGSDKPSTIEVRGKTLAVWKDGDKWMWRTPGSSDSIGASEALKGVIEGKLAERSTSDAEHQGESEPVDTKEVTESSTGRSTPDAEQQDASTEGGEEAEPAAPAAEEKPRRKSQKQLMAEVKPRADETPKWNRTTRRPGAQFSTFTTAHPTKGKASYTIHSQALSPELVDKTPLSDWQISLLKTPQWKAFSDEAWDEDKTQPVDLDFLAEAGDDAFGITGAGHAKDVFSKVINATKAFLDKESPPVMIFTAAEESRAKLYRNITKRIGKKTEDYVPFEADVKGVGTMFFAVRKNKVDRFTQLAESLGTWKPKQIDVESKRGKFSRQVTQFQRAYYNLASESEEAAWWESGEGSIRVLADGEPFRYTKHSGGFSAERIGAKQ